MFCNGKCALTSWYACIYGELHYISVRVLIKFNSSTETQLDAKNTDRRYVLVYEQTNYMLLNVYGGKK